MSEKVKGGTLKGGVKVEMSPEAASTTPTSTPPTTPSGHRSRKEKLVLRSFSTEMDEIQPRLLSHEEYFGSRGGPPKKRGSRTRSAPLPSSSPRSREGSEEEEEEEEDDPEGNEEQGPFDQTQDDDDEGEEPSPPNKKVKRKRKTKPIEDYDEGEEGEELDVEDEAMEEDAKTKTSSGGGGGGRGESSKTRRKSYGKVGKPPKDGRKLVKRRLEWPSSSGGEGKVRKHRTGSLSLSQEMSLSRRPNHKSSPSTPSTPSSNIIKSKFLRRHSLLPNPKAISTRSPFSSYAKKEEVSPVSSSSSSSRARSLSGGGGGGGNKVTFSNPVVADRFPVTRSPSPVPPSPPTRQLVKYRVPEKFAKIMANNRAKYPPPPPPPPQTPPTPPGTEEVQPEETTPSGTDSQVEIGAGAGGGVSGTKTEMSPPPPPPPPDKEMSNEKKKEEESSSPGPPAAEPQAQLLLPPPPPPPSPSQNSLFTAPQPPDSLINHSHTPSSPQQPPPPPSPEVGKPFSSHPPEQDPCHQKELDTAYAKGLSALQHLMSDYTPTHTPKGPSSSKLSFTIPDLCRESIASLLSLLAKSPSQILLTQTKNKKKGLKLKEQRPRAPADKDSSTSSSSGSESEPDPSQDEDPADASIQRFLSHGRSLLRGSGGELSQLLKQGDSLSTGAEYRPNFVLGSYTAPDGQRDRGVPRLTVGELEIFKELMTPDESFMLYEDEQELANLYCELVRTELCQLNTERRRRGEMEGAALILQGSSDGGQFGGRKIVDAFPLLVKPALRPHFPAEVLIKEEELVGLIMKGKENQLKELNTRRLRNGKQIPLKKIHLRNKATPTTTPMSTSREETSPSSYLSRGAAPGCRDAATLPAANSPLPGGGGGGGGGGSFDPFSQMNLKRGGAGGGSTNLNTMKLRDGKEIPLRGNGGGGGGQTRIYLPPSLHGGQPSGPGGVGKEEVPLTPTKPDEYCQRVEASLRGLEVGSTGGATSSSSGGGGSALEALLMDTSSSPPSSSSSSFTMGSSGRCRTQPLGRLNTLFLGNPPFSPANSASSTSPTGSGGGAEGLFHLSGYNSTTQNSRGLNEAGGSPSSPSSNSSSSSSSFMFKPIQPHPLTSLPNSPNSPNSPSSLDGYSPRGGVSPSFHQPQESHQFFNFIGQQGQSLRTSSPSGSGLMSSGSPLLASPLNKSRYSRQKHSSLCPPFDNNHCSYNYHHCSYPRAPNSRFCIHHVGEGATVNFERCKYVKGSRECGRFIPRSSSQALFCDIHALTIANAHIKKSRPRKPLDKSPGLLKHMRCNLDRAEGKIMERDGQGGFCVRKDFLEDERETLNNSSHSDESDDDGVGGGGGTLLSTSSVGSLYRAQKGDEDSDVEDCEGPSGGVDGDTPDYATLKTAGYYTVEECVRMSQAALLKQKELMGQELELLKRQYSSGWKAYLLQLQTLRGARVNFTTDPKLISTTSSGLSAAQIQTQVKVHNETMAALAHRRWNSGPRSLLRAAVLRRRQEVFESSRSSATPTPTPSSSSESPLPLSQPLPLPLSPNETKEEVKLRIRRARKGGTRPILCAFGAGTHEKCKERGVPLSKFCFKHITQDKFQKLHVPCNFRLGPDSDDVCSTPVHSLLEKYGCPLHALPIPLKDPPESQNKKAKVEEDIDRLMEEPGMESSGDEEEEQEQPTDDPLLLNQGQGQGHDEETIIREMEELVGDEVVDLEHFRETLSSVYARGLYVTDSEESEDTEEEEEDQQPPPLLNL